MKRCPRCRRDYMDETLNFCVDDGTALLEGPSSGGSGASRTVTFFDKPATVALYQGDSGSGNGPAPAVPAWIDGESTIYSEAPRLGDPSTELSPLIGRTAELREIMGLLCRPEIRLLTITGVGGTGKTRIAQAIAHNSIGLFPDGVYFIGLSAIESTELVLPIIAQALGVSEEAGTTLRVSVLEHLRRKRLLIVLDNFEQVTDAAPQIGELVSRSTNLSILVTSRVRLHLRVEHEFPLPPLTLPAEGMRRLDELEDNPAVALFAERAKAIKPAFALTSDNVGSIADICRRLDGLPLAIELAAVRSKLLAPQALLTRLSSSLKLLTGGARDVPERQRTMRGAIQWSYDLLDREEKSLLNRLSVFAGGFTLEAAEAVAYPGDDLSTDLLDVIASLVDKSLLVQRDAGDGEPRFRMLQVVREFAAEALQASGEADQYKRLHGEYYARIAESAQPELLSEKAAEWMDLLEQEHDNLRSAMEWSLAGDPDIALRISGAIYWFWFNRGHLSEGIKWTKQALESPVREDDAKLRSKVYLAIGVLSSRKGDVDEAELYAKEGLRRARDIDDKNCICNCLSILGVVKTNQDDLAQARKLTEESLVIARELNNLGIISGRLNTLGEIARRQEDYEAAREFYEEALALGRQQSAKMFVVSPALNLAAVACYQKNYDAALEFALESLSISEEMRDKIYVGLALAAIAAIAVGSGLMTDAARLFGAAHAVFDSTGSKLERVDQIFVDRYIGEAQAAIGQKAFEAALKEGKSITLDKATALARKISEQIAISY